MSEVPVFPTSSTFNVTSLTSTPDPSVPGSSNAIPGSPTPTSLAILITSNLSSTTPTSKHNTSIFTSARFSTGTIVGVLIGGLVAGALLAIVVVLFLRFRSRRAALKGTNPPPSPAWEEEKGKLLKQLNDVQVERAQLRTYLQLADTQDPRDVVELFNKLNVSIKNSCLLASGAVLKSVQLGASWTTKDAKNLGQLQKDLGGAATLVLSEKGAGRKPEEFLPQAISYVVNSALVDNLFRLFHPGISRDENNLLSDMYRNIRHRDPQRLSARWRCLAYTAIDNRLPPSADWSGRFADDVLKKLSSVISSLLGVSPSVFPARFRKELTSIGTEAYKWNRLVKSTFKALDFQPVLFTSTDSFNPLNMTLYLNHKASTSSSQKIVVAFTLALRSSESKSLGEEITEESVWQTKAEVVTERFFQ